MSVTAVLNFSLAASLALLLGIPLSLSALPLPEMAREAKAMAFYAFAAVTFLGAALPERGAPYLWEIFGGWFLPFWCMVYLPLALQATVVALGYQ